MHHLSRVSSLPARTSEYQQQTWRQRQDHVCICIHTDNADALFATRRLVSETIPAPDLTILPKCPTCRLENIHPVARVRIAHVLCIWPCVNRGGHQGRTHRKSMYE